MVQISICQFLHATNDDTLSSTTQMMDVFLISWHIKDTNKSLYILAYFDQFQLFHIISWKVA